MPDQPYWTSAAESALGCFQTEATFTLPILRDLCRVRQRSELCLADNWKGTSLLAQDWEAMEGADKVLSQVAQMRFAAPFFAAHFV